MSLHDFNIANQTFPNARADINSALLALVGNSTNATAPTTTFKNMWWYDSTAGVLKKRNNADTAWETISDLISLTGITDNSTEPAIVISSDEVVNMPLQPCFMATLTQQGPIAPDAFTTLDFDTEVFDQGSNFNTANNTFTAPVTGRYLMGVVVELDVIDTAATQLRIDLNSSNDPLIELIRLNPSLDASSDFRRSLAGAMLIDMDAADTVTAQVMVSGGATQMYAYAASRFYGALLC